MARDGLRQKTVPASIILAQKLRRNKVLAHEWAVSPDGKNVLLAFRHTNFLPYYWELGRQRRTSRLETVMSRLKETHEFRWTFVSGKGGKVPIEEVKTSIGHIRKRLCQLQKSEVLRRSNVVLVAVKIELTIDITHPDLLTYVHAHCIFAIPRAMKTAQIPALRSRIAGFLDLSVGRFDRLRANTAGYLLKHPVKLDWGSGTGYLPNLLSAAQLRPSHAVRIYRATVRLCFFTTTRSHTSALCPSLGRLIKATQHQTVNLFVPDAETGRYLSSRAGAITDQRRTFERIAKRIRVYPLNKEAHLRAFTDACRTFWGEYFDLKELGLPVVRMHLNCLCPRPVHRRPADVPQRRWEADLRRIRKMRATIDVIEIAA